MEERKQNNLVRSWILTSSQQQYSVTSGKKKKKKKTVRQINCFSLTRN